jgi:hypothetical protein
LDIRIKTSKILDTGIKTSKFLNFEKILTIISRHRRPHGNISQQPMKQPSLDPKIRLRMDFLERQQQKHPHQISRNAINIIDQHKQHFEQRSWIPNNISEI